MVMARLHVICGNCGCDDLFEWEYKPLVDDEDDPQPEDVYLWCRNCSTLHLLNDNAKNKRPRMDNKQE